ncbi:MAG: HAD family hydrolase [Pseudomonadota bacterium]|nr:HAD family hydrolase [Pseudomonadota bacterium]MEE3098409.1 HAD family hydrolase [Pseudomonadota bacterium]
MSAAARAPRLICDLDGTLADSAPSLCAAGNRVLASLGRPPVDVETYKTFVGRGQRVQVERLLTHTGGVPGGDATPFLEAFRAGYDPLEASSAYPGAVAALETLAAEGWRLAVCTQKTEVKARRLLAGLGFAVEHVVGGDSVTGPDGAEVLKPDPRVIGAALAPLGEGPAVYVGDSETDAETAAAAGLPFLLHLEGYRKSPPEALAPFGSFSDFSELPGLARRAAGFA